MNQPLYRQPMSFQDLVDQFDTEALDPEERVRLQESARALVLNPTLTRMLSRMEAMEIKAILDAENTEAVMHHRRMVDAMREFRRQLMGLAQDLTFEAKRASRKTKT